MRVDVEPGNVLGSGSSIGGWADPEGATMDAGGRRRRRRGNPRPGSAGRPGRRKLQHRDSLGASRRIGLIRLTNDRKLNGLPSMYLQPNTEEVM